MGRFIALLRGVNVGGNRSLPMAELRALAESLGLERPATLLASGNLVFGAKGKTAPALEALLEKATEKRFGAPIAYLVRSSEAWDQVLAANPMPAPAKDHPGKFVVMPLKAALTKERLALLRSKIVGPEAVEQVGPCLYIDFPDGQGTSKFSQQLTERVLGTVGTARNWNTALKLAALAGQ